MAENSFRKDKLEEANKASYKLTTLVAEYIKEEA